MSLTAADVPTPLPCGPLNQAWIDQLNGTLLDYFTCILANQSENIATNQDLDQLIADLPSIICNEISPRFFQQTLSGGGGTKTITIPSGGTWVYIAIPTATNDESGTLQTGTNVQWFQFDTGSNDEIAFGSRTGLVAGGSQISFTSGNDATMLSVFAYRVDCP